jgi:hypothetical protein
MQRAQVVVFITQRLDGPRPVMEFRAVPNRTNQLPLREKLSENKIALRDGAYAQVWLYGSAARFQGNMKNKTAAYFK